MDRIVLKRRMAASGAGIGITCIILYLLRIVGISDSMPDILGLLVIMLCSIGVVDIIKSKCRSREELIVILSAYLLHIIVLLIDIYGKQYISILHSGADSEGFYRISEQYYHNDYTHYLTKYPVLLNGLYQIMGLNRLAAQYINVLFWVFGEVILMSICDVLDICRKYRFITVALFGLLPNYLCLTSVLLRESIISFFILFSFYYLLKWMQGGKKTHIVRAFLIAIPAIILHSGSIAVWISYGLIYAFYNPKLKKFKIGEKTLVVLLFGMGGLIFIYLDEKMKGLFLSYVPDLTGNIVADVNSRLAIAQRYGGNAGYLTNVQISGYGDLILRTLQRMYYFFFSPMPFYWRGLQDITAFLADSSFYIISSVAGIQGLLKNRKDPYLIAMLTILCSVAGVFAWGVSNAGTAMRHRSKVLGIALILLIYCLQKKKLKS